MNQIWILTRRELNSYFDSLLAYIVIILFLGFTGLFTWLYGTDVFLRKEASLDVFFNISFWTLLFFIPALTMRLIAEENSSGTLELILTKPVSEWQLVTGKFISTLVLIAIALVLTLPYYFTIWGLGPVDHGAVWSVHLLFSLLSLNLKGWAGSLLNFLSARAHYDSVTRGVIDSKDLIYFLSLTFLGLFASEIIITKRNVTES